ncbi:MAG: DUF5924 family protein [Panacagrimonas sp.]
MSSPARNAAPRTFVKGGIWSMTRLEPTVLWTDTVDSVETSRQISQVSCPDKSSPPEPKWFAHGREWLARSRAFLDRFPWLLPTASFAFGWVGFFLFQRGEHLARVIALIAVLGWPWLFAENLLGRWLVARSHGRLSIGAVRFVTQQIQQEILFFALPFLFGASLWVPGHVVFMAVAVAVAIVISIDPIYLHRLAPHAGLSSALHAYCTFIAALVVLPVALHLPLDEALPLSLLITMASLLASLPRMLLSVGQLWMRLAGCGLLVFALALSWSFRGWIPPAGLWVRHAFVTASIEDLNPGAPVETVSEGDLHAHGAVSYVAVRAPTGLSQSVVFDWYHEGALVDRIPGRIAGGREEGFRTYSRKQNFPGVSIGRWRVDLLTPQGQLVARSRFNVVAGAAGTARVEEIEAPVLGDVAPPDARVSPETSETPESSAQPDKTPEDGPSDHADEPPPADELLTIPDHSAPDDRPADDPAASGTDAPPPGSADH